MPDSVPTTSANTILKIAGAEAPDSVKPGPLTSTQKAGLRLATGVGIFAFLVTLAIGIAWWHLSPGAPHPPALDSDGAAKYIQNYSALSKAAHDSVNGVFDPVVVKVLLPVFTSILGYIFGTQRLEAQSAAGDRSKSS